MSEVPRREQGRLPILQSLRNTARRGETLPASPTQTLRTPLPIIPLGALIAGKYKIVDEIGRGGMGIVYKAEDTKLKRTVVPKFLSPELVRDEDAKERFIHEAQAASALQHPNICSVY
jgi:serine/threonine protein kinase